MEQKILCVLNQINKRLDGIDGRLDGIDVRLDGVDQRLDGIDARLDGVDQRLDGVDEKFGEMDQKIDDLREELLGQQFLFEHEYGTKIDAIFDAVTLELDKNIEKSEKIRKLDGRTERNEITIFNHEKRISKLELNR